jgi:hypothetical protein
MNRIVNLKGIGQSAMRAQVITFAGWLIPSQFARSKATNKYHVQSGLIISPLFLLIFSISHSRPYFQMLVQTPDNTIHTCILSPIKSPGDRYFLGLTPIALDLNAGSATAIGVDQHPNLKKNPASF